MDPPAWFDRAHQGTPSGTWSDDGLMRSVLASLLERGCFDPYDLAGRLLTWREAGYMAVDGRVFDCGIQTSRPALAAAGPRTGEAGRTSARRQA
jgi:ADP-ribosyl-[dinitrogen reductase] hydrolase